MPGHKRTDITEEGIIPYNIDITEIHDFDNLHSPNGVIDEIQKKAAKLYNAKNAFILINGSTGGILSAIRSMTNQGDKILMARNCHKSVYNSAELFNLNVDYIFPDTDSRYNILTSVSPCDIEDKLTKHNDEIRLVIITSPTYEGVVSDIKSISEICHKHGAKLLVDEAHGAHFPFSDSFPDEALNCGADAAVLSLHKTLPSLTQTALLIANDSELSEILAENLAVFETSSPSYILMSSIEKCLDFCENSKDKFKEYCCNLKTVRKKLENLKYLKIYDKIDKITKEKATNEYLAANATELQIPIIKEAMDIQKAYEKALLDGVDATVALTIANDKWAKSYASNDFSKMQSLLEIQKEIDKNTPNIVKEAMVIYTTFNFRRFHNVHKNYENVMSQTYQKQNIFITHLNLLLLQIKLDTNI